MSSNPTIVALAEADFLVKHGLLGRTVLGSCISKAGHRAEASFAHVNHEMRMQSITGPANTNRVMKLRDWYALHLGHTFTHAGAVANAKGTMDVWFCQEDNEFCMDTVS